MKIFERRAHTDESLTLGSNTEDRRFDSCNNLDIVFVKRPDSPYQASR